MNRLLTVARLLAAIVVVNIISSTFLVVCGFTDWDIAATLTSLILSACIINIELASRWSYVKRETFLNILILCVLLGGASSFFWFFHMIYKIGHYQGDYIDMLWSTPTKVIAFVVSIQLILKAHHIYTILTLELLEDAFEEKNVTPLSRTRLSVGELPVYNKQEPACPA